MTVVAPTVLLSASRPELIPVFTGLSKRQFRPLVGVAARRGDDLIAEGRPGRPWSPPMADRVLPVAVYYRTNLAMRQAAPLFGIKQAAAHRVIDRLARSSHARRSADSTHPSAS